MSRQDVRARIRELQAALGEEPTELDTASSPEAARSSGGQGLARLPYLTFNDIVALRTLGISTIEELEDRLLEVPELVWPHVLDLVRSRVIEISPLDLEAELEAGDNGAQAPRCLALTKSGTRCRNKARGESKYCSSHKGYQPTEEELAARRQGLLPGR